MVKLPGRGGLLGLPAVAALLLVAMMVGASSTVQAAEFNITSSTYFGDASANERVVGVAIQSDGDLVVALNVGPAAEALTGAVLLNNATANSRGAVVLLSPDGTQVKAKARLADAVFDVDVDSDDRIYVAVGRQGGLALDAALAGVRFKVATDVSGAKLAFMHRVDVGTADTVAWLTSGLDASESALAVSPGRGNVVVTNADTGAESARFASHPSTGRNALDLVVHDASGTVVVVGWRQATSVLQVAHIVGLAMSNGALRWTGYDWSTDTASPRYINRPESNAADTRLSRAALGEDGKLYAAGHSAGGNNIYRYRPDDIMTKAALANYDLFASWAGGRDQHQGFVGRYTITASAITFESGQPVVTRVTDKNNSARSTPNTLVFEGGAVAADANGRIYLGGTSACCLPLPPNRWFTPGAGEQSFNPFDPSAYNGGAFFIVLDVNSTTKAINRRAYAARVAFGHTRAVAVRSFSGVPRIAYGGSADLKDRGIYATSNAIQTAPGQLGSGLTDGFLVAHVRGQTAPGPAGSNGEGDGARSSSSRTAASWLHNLAGQLEP